MPYIRNKRTGEVVFVPDQPAGPPRDPTFPYQGPQAAANLQKTQAEIEAENRRVSVQEAELRQRQAEFAASQRAAGMMQNAQGQWVRDPDFRKTPDLSPAIREQGIGAFNSAVDLGSRIIPQLEETYRKGPGATKGLGGIRDFLPLPENQMFNSAANQLRGFVKEAQGFTGGEGNTLGEMQLNVGAFIPSAGDFDSTTEKNLKALRAEGQRALRTNVAVLGGIPDSNGSITPVPQGYRVGQYPDLDLAIAQTISGIPADKRASWIMRTKQLFEERRAAKGGGTAGAPRTNVIRYDSNGRRVK